MATIERPPVVQDRNCGCRASAPSRCRLRCRSTCARAIGRSRSFRCGSRRAFSHSPMARASCVYASIPTRCISIRTSPSSRRTNATGAGTLGARLARRQRCAGAGDRMGPARRSLRRCARGVDRARARTDQSRGASDRADCCRQVAADCARVPLAGRDRRWSTRRLAPRARGALDARPLGRDRAVGRSAGDCGTRSRCRASARSRTRPQGAARDDEQRCARDRRRHEMDGRLRCSRGQWMGLRIAIPAATLAAGIDSLFVLGAAASQTADATASQLADLLDAHHYTDGLEFLHAGYADQQHRRSARGLSQRRPRTRAQLRARGRHRPSTFDADTNAVRVGTALGLPGARVAPVLGRIGQAAEHHGRSQRSINAVMWPSSWGYMLSNMIGFDGTGLTTDTIAWAREHFVTSVRSAGPFPCLRCGRQPYGVLPVTSLDGWKPRTGDEAAFARERGCNRCCRICARASGDRSSRTSHASGGGRARPIPTPTSPT